MPGSPSSAASVRVAVGAGVEARRRRPRPRWPGRRCCGPGNRGIGQRVGVDRRRGRRRVGKWCVSAPSGRVSGLPYAVDEPAGHGARAGDRDLLADDGPDRHLGAVDGAGHADPGSGGDEAAEQRVGAEQPRRRPRSRRRGRAAAGPGRPRAPRRGGLRGAAWRGRGPPRGAASRGRRWPRRAAAGAPGGTSCRRTPRRRGRPCWPAGRAASGRRTAAGSPAAAPSCPGTGAAPRAAALSRRSRGVVAKTARTVSLNCRMLAKPAAKATSESLRSVVSIRVRAVCARWARASAWAPAPTSATSSRCSWRSL